MVLHAGNTHRNTYKALIAAEYCGVELKMVPDFEMWKSNRTPEFLKMNPLGKVPVLETTEGPVFESNAIPRYVARLKSDNSLYGSSLIDYYHVEQWMDFIATEVVVNLSRWLYPRLGYMVYLPPAEDDAVARLKRALGELNTRLASSTYLVGDDVTLADIVLTCVLHSGFVHIMTKSFTSEFPHMERYFWTMVYQPNVNRILGEVKQAEKIPAAPSAKPKPNEAPKPKEVAFGEEVLPKPKAKNPLDLLLLKNRSCSCSTAPGYN